MPVYEFYCADCHTVFNFFSPGVNTAKRPDCPRCGKHELERWMSVFAINKRRGGEAALADSPQFDEAKLNQAISELAQKTEKLDEADPRQAAELMRTFCRSTGLEMGAGMQEALDRFEAGEDPEKIEAELGEALEQEEPFQESSKRSGNRRGRPPEKDEKFYRLS